MPLPVKLIAVFGQDLTAATWPQLQRALRDGWSLLALNTGAMKGALDEGVPFATIDEWLDRETLNRCAELAMEAEKAWYLKAADDLTYEGICWPEFDRDAMNFFWRDTICAGAFMESFFEESGEFLSTVRVDPPKPSLYYYRSDAWKEVVHLYQRKRTGVGGISGRDAAVNSILEWLKANRTIEVGDGGNAAQKGQERLPAAGHMIAHVSRTENVAFVLNSGEIPRFASVIADVAKATSGRVQVYLAHHNPAAAQQWSGKLGIPVSAAPRPSEGDRKVGERFYEGYRKAIRASQSDFWLNSLCVEYHFDYYCRSRWPQLAQWLSGWTRLWEQEKPGLVIGSSLMDAESQLPIEAANRFGIETFSLPHARLPRVKNLQRSKYILYDFNPYRDLQIGAGVNAGRCLKCRNILGDYPYSTTSRVTGTQPERQVSILVLTAPSFLGSEQDQLFTPWTIPRMQIEELRNLAAIPKDLTERVNVTFKVYPLYPEHQVFEMAHVDRATLLPPDSDLTHVLSAINLVVELNGASTTAVLHCLNAQRPVCFVRNGIIQCPDLGLDRLLEAGERLDSAEAFWKFVRHCLGEPSVLTALVERGRQFLKHTYIGMEEQSFADVINTRLEALRQSRDKGIDRMLCQAGLFMSRGVMAEAEKCYRQILELDPRNADAMNNLGVIAAKSSQTAAEALFEEALKSDPAHLMSNENLRLVRAFRGRSRISSREDEIHNIDADPEFYYGEIPKGDLEQILEAGRTSGRVEDAIRLFCDRKQNEYFREYALDARRALGLQLLGSLKRKRLLDYGCGIGSIGVIASQMGAHVTFVDSCVMRLETALARCRERGLKGNEFIACRSWESLADIGVFDFIVLNGILEWVPSTTNSTFENVIKTQLDFLRKMAALLDQNGTIFLAIENRFALKYLLGYPEDHTNIPYLSLMPRDRANALHLEQKGKEFVNWTWGYEDYQRLLPEIGLRLAEGFAMFPDYRFPRSIVPLDDNEGLRCGLRDEGYEHSDKGRMIDYFGELGHLRHVVYSYGLLLKGNRCGT